MTTHYFFAAVRFGIVPRTPAEDLDIRERISVARRLAFEEQDAPVVEAQQRKILESGGTRAPALLSVDAGPVRVQRVLRGIDRCRNSSSKLGDILNRLSIAVALAVCVMTISPARSAQVAGAPVEINALVPSRPPAAGRFSPSRTSRHSALLEVAVNAAGGTQADARSRSSRPTRLTSGQGRTGNWST